MANDYLKKLLNNHIWLGSINNGKLVRHAYESALNALNMIGVSITYDALYERMERESKRMAPTEVIVDCGRLIN